MSADPALEGLSDIGNGSETPDREILNAQRVSPDSVQSQIAARLQ